MRCLPTCRDCLRKAGLRDRKKTSGRQGGCLKGRLYFSPGKLLTSGLSFALLRAVFCLKTARSRHMGKYSIGEEKMPMAGYALGFRKVLLQMDMDGQVRMEGMMTMRIPL